MSDYFTAPAPVVNSTTSDKTDVNDLTAAVEAGFDAAQADIEAGNLLFKKIDIGDWNMDTTTTVNVTHGLDFHKMGAVIGIIRGDLTTVASFPILQQSISGAKVWIDSVNSATIVLKCDKTQFPIISNYNATSYNRGKLIVQYIL